MYLMYLRKSRADNPSETVESVLRKHYTILQDFCEREFGARIPECDIYREVVSGESIEDRVEIKKVLSRIEDPAVDGIIVVEPQRLSRGDLVDCGNLINTLRFSHTVVVTPYMSYNMDNKMERRFFQDELLRGRDYLEYTKDILMRGKMASINRGCYLQAIPPFGYDRVKIGKDNTLAPNADAETVKLIFELFVNRGLSTWEIGQELQRLGIKSPTGRETWAHATLEKILKNQHYIGKVTYQKYKTTVGVVDGVVTTRRVNQPAGSFICVEGKHPAIIDRVLFDAAQARIASRPPVKKDAVLRNALAGLVYCGRCGHAMTYKDRSGSRQYLACQTPGCSKSIKYPLMVDTVLQALEQSELPELEARYLNGDGEAAAIQRRRIAALEKELTELRAQEETQYELLETKKYTQALFDRRNKALRDKMSATEANLKEARRSLPAAVDYKEKTAALRDAIAALRDPAVPELEKNRLLKCIIERIDCMSNQTERRGVFDFSLNIKLRI